MQLHTPDSQDFVSIQALLAANHLPTDDIRNPAIHFRIWKKGDDVVACGALEPLDNCCLLRSVAVASASRKQGIAARLTRSLLAESAAEKFGDVYLLTNDADAYFSRLGFVRIDRDQAPDAIKHSNQFSVLCPDSAVLMRYLATGI